MPRKKIAKKTNTSGPDAATTIDSSNQLSVVLLDDTAGIRRFANDVSVVSRDLDQVLTTLKTKLQITTHAAPKRFISAVERLPVESLSKIFILTRPRPKIEHIDHYFGTLDEGFGVSFNASQVCRRWRSIALDLPRLWTPIHLIGSQATLKSKLEPQLTMLSRTASLPVYLVVGIPSVNVQFLNRCEKGLLSTFEERCKGIDIYAVQDKKKNTVSFPYTKIRGLLSRFDKVEKLMLIGFDFDTDLTAPFTSWRNLTHLHVRLCSQNSVQVFCSFSIPRLNVLVLELDRGTILPDLASISYSYPNLTDFFICGQFSQRSEPLYHSQIERLAVIRAGARGCSFLLDTAIVPSLTELAVSFDSNTENLVAGLVSRSECRLRRLGLASYALMVDGSGEERCTQISERLAVPIVECDADWCTMKMMRDLKTRWYEQEYVMSPYS
ncbi:hypothetical protein CONPUDRAFT_149629 [Coniophora puteana RWD-64-598 SS2]|uniref:Uncharacterized protein n=1 Tax=Coniophora puteana (strain RWD-64-598) TaxID=741705 RepID=A0A5M3N065_CONPW|nr:uncharacterized protein CONPUDRAFT_149629 [Coniophora puteana RWD-64-598 SS2]EIW84758.1 hypothetical protein CONPUDRAFT_149629 [Coniophora puteana RWD-64-598 SS2]